MDGCLTQTVQHRGFQRAWSHNTAPVLHSVQPQARSSNSGVEILTRSLLRVSRSCSLADLVTQVWIRWRTKGIRRPGRSRSRGFVVIPNALASAEVKRSWILVHRYCSHAGGAGRGSVYRAGDSANRVNAGVRLTSACGDVVGPGV